MKTKWVFNAASSLVNFEILNEPRLNGVYSRDNLQIIKIILILIHSE